MENSSENSTRLEQSLEIVETLIPQILELSRRITPEGWELAAAEALHNQKWHTGDVAIIRDIRLISMRGGTRYKPEYKPSSQWSK